MWLLLFEGRLLVTGYHSAEFRVIWCLLPSPLGRKNVTPGPPSRHPHFGPTPTPFTFYQVSFTLTPCPWHPNSLLPCPHCVCSMGVHSHAPGTPLHLPSHAHNEPPLTLCCSALTAFAAWVFTHMPLAPLSSVLFSQLANPLCCSALTAFAAWVFHP